MKATDYLTTTDTYTDIVLNASVYSLVVTTLRRNTSLQIEIKKSSYQLVLKTKTWESLLTIHLTLTFVQTFLQGYIFYDHIPPPEFSIFSLPCFSATRQFKNEEKISPAVQKEG